MTTVDLGQNKETIRELLITANPARYITVPPGKAKLAAERGWPLDFITKNEETQIGDVIAVTEYLEGCPHYGVKAKEWRGVVCLVTSVPQSPMMLASLTHVTETWNAEPDQTA